MAEIKLLDQSTINKIAAGEVIERPRAVVKELAENAIDANASAITVEIKEGGLSFIRITDNGCGIENAYIKTAFLQHATSKIRSAQDLIAIASLGFRGEALSSIAAVAQVELVTKTKSEVTGTRYVIEGGVEKSTEEIGCPEGTTFIIRNLFYNTPARRKFLKAASSEAGYISDLVEHLAVSHPEVSFKFINNGNIKLHSSGNRQIKDVIYNIYGREVANNLLEIEGVTENISVNGYIGKPVVSRGNRNYENYYINGRYIKSKIIDNAIEDAYKPYSMSHRYPFTALHFNIKSDCIDVNVHPSKMEIRFTNKDEIYLTTYKAISAALSKRELIPDISIVKVKEEKKVIKNVPEPFEKKRREEIKSDSIMNYPYRKVVSEKKEDITKDINEDNKDIIKDINEKNKDINEIKNTDNILVKENTKYNQIDLFKNKLLSKEALKNHKIVGQIFNTYWIVEYEDKMFLIDQHAAHEKVLFEENMKLIRESNMSTQMLQPPIILSLSMSEEESLKKHKEVLTKFGFEIEHFGGKEYAVSGVPSNLPSIGEKDLLIELIDSLESLATSDLITPDILLEKVASMSCKAAVKGGNKLSYSEAKELIDRLLELENPYHCPHGRPTIVSMSKYEIEKKFKRII